MKLLSPSVAALLALLIGSAPALVAQTTDSPTFIAPGVSVSDVGGSDHFYDNGKGYYWQSWNLTDSAENLYEQSNSWDFLGELSARVPNDATPGGTPFYTNLTNDAETCWYNASSNILQYWQDYYGVFYRGNGDAGNGNTTLPDGYTYDSEYLNALGGTQSLRIDMLFYDNWKNVGGNIAMSAGWYLAGDTSDPNLTGNAGGGFFKDYFASPTDTYVVKYEADGLSLSEIKEMLVGGFGLTQGADGTFSQQTPGQIVSFDIGSVSEGSGHAITCYGFTLDAEGQLSSVLIANSDDMTYGLETVYLSADESGQVFLYKDAECTERWDYADVQDWRVDQIGYIKTPASLQNMYAQYADADNPLVWNGQRQGGMTWTAADAAASSGDLPTEATGWDVYVSQGQFSGYYHAYAGASRPVEFGDHGMGGEVTVEGKVSARKVILSGQGVSYSFSGSSSGSASITTDLLHQTGGGTNTFTNLSVNATTTTVDSGRLVIGAGAALTGTTGTVRGDAELVLDGGRLNVGSVSIRDSATFAVSAQGGGLDGSLTMGSGTSLSFELGDSALTSPLLTLTGNLTLEGPVYLDLTGTLTEGTSYQLVGLTGSLSGNWEECFQGYDGTLIFSDNTLILQYQAPRTLTWSGGSGIWSSTLWDSASGSPDGASLTFTAEGATASPATVTVQGEVAPGALAVTGGTYIFAAGEGASISGDRDVTISNDARVTTALNFTGRRVELQDTASLTYAVSGSSEIRSLSADSGTTLNFTGEGSLYTVLASSGLNGSLNVEDATLAFRFLSDATIAATVSTNDAASLHFLNASSTSDIAYTLSGGTAGIKGTVVIGSEADAYGTTLRVSGDAAGSYELSSQGVLSLQGNGSFSGSAVGAGRVEVAEGAQVDFAVNAENGNKLNLGNSVSLLIRGDVSAGSANSNTAYMGGSDAAIEIDGGSMVAQVNKIQAYGVSDGASFSRVALREGSLTFNVTALGESLSAYGYSPLATVQELEVSGGGSDLIIAQNDYYSGVNAVEVSRLSGDGTLRFTADNAWLTPQVLTIDDTAAGSRVNLEIKAQSDLFNNDYFGSAVAELRAGQLGEVSLSNAGASDNTRAGFGIAGDVTIGALSGEETTSFIYSGRLIASTDTLFESDKDGSNRGIAAAIKAESHTLTIDSEASGEFAGSVLQGTGSGSESDAALSIVKRGTGTQIFNGGAEGLQGGDIRLEAGALGICSSLTAGDVILASGTTLATDGTLQVTGAFRAGLGTCMTRVSEEPGATTLDLSQASALDMTGTVNLDSSSSLVLGSAPIDFTLGGEALSLWESTGELELFVNATQVTFDGVLYIDESVTLDANLFLRGDALTESAILAYDAATHSVLLLGAVPEPATATLSLLALAGLLGRRRRS